MENAQEENAISENLKSLVNDIGHCVADFNRICVDHLNEDFEFKSQLPYGKFLSDVTGLSMGLSSFEEVATPELDNYVAAPVNKVPPNPFTGVADPAILLECMNVINSEETQEEFDTLFNKSFELFGELQTHRELLLRVEKFNKALQTVEAHYIELDKPQKRMSTKTFGKNISRKAKTKIIDEGKRQYLAAIHFGIGIEVSDPFDTDKLIAGDTASTG